MAMLEINDCHSFFDVQLAGMALRVHALEIVQAIGQVGILLHFAKDHASADSVRGAGRNKESVAAGNRQALKEILQTTLFDGRFELFQIYFGSQSEEQRRSRFGGNCMPHFRFSAGAGRFMFRGVVVFGDAPEWKVDRLGRGISPAAENRKPLVRWQSWNRATPRAF